MKFVYVIAILAYLIGSALKAQEVSVGDITIEDMLRSRPELKLAATTDNRQVLINNFLFQASIEKETKLTLSMDSYRLEIMISPAQTLEVKNPIAFAPNIKVSLDKIIYHFYNSKFEAKTKVNYDLGQTSAALVNKAIALYMNKYIKPKIPPYMQRPGFNPWKDVAPEVLTVDLHGCIMELTSSDEPGESLTLKDAHGAVNFFAPYTKVIPIGDDNLAQLKILKGTKLALTVYTKGIVNTLPEPVHFPRLTKGKLQVLGPKNILVETLDESGRSIPFKGLEVKEINLKYAGDLDVVYNFDIEHVADLFMNMACATDSLSSGRDFCSAVEEVKIKKLRRGITPLIQKQTFEALAWWLNTYNEIIPNWSLTNVFGIPLEIHPEQ